MAKKTDLLIAKEKAHKYAKILQKDIDIQKIYLFGSYVSGTNHKDSDIDIAVVSKSFKDDPVDDGVLLMRYCSKVDSMIEPHPFLPRDFNNDNLIANEVIKTGIRII
ncbi:MAG: nucleotidyltransferase domain-containing protein [Endomicrobium sp.]|jgi:predicted nucleotidyltransferase|nr:nucleotidyltransferase domain-containing protein [Endomicrobium sp.]